jgi:predicted Zn-dependent protease
MKVFFLLSLACLLNLLVSCSNKLDEKKIEGKEKEINDSTRSQSKIFLTDCLKLKTEAQLMDSVLLTQTEMDSNAANKAIKAFTDFAFYCSSDTLSPVYLIKTAQIAQTINNISQAKVVLDKCIVDYPNFKNRPAALFLLAQLYDEPTYLNNEQEAKALYQKIIDEYPKNDWVQSAKGAIKFIGMSDSQIIEELKKKKQ